MEYVVFTSDALAGLVGKVMEALRNGWQLQGGICKSDKWAQAMTRPTQQPAKKK